MDKSASLVDSWVKLKGTGGQEGEGETFFNYTKTNIKNLPEKLEWLRRSRR